MKLISAWKDLLSVFAPKNLSRFLLVAANTLKQSFQVFLRYWWWLLPMYLFVCIYSGQLYEPLDTVLPKVIMSLMAFIFFLSMRPSVDHKEFRYFFNYRFHMIYYFFIYLFLMKMGLYFYKESSCFFNYFFQGFFSGGLMGHLFNLFSFGMSCAILLGMFILHSWFAMFFLDSNGTAFAALQSLYRSFKMVIYNVPFLIATIFLFGIVSVLLFFSVFFFMNLLGLFLATNNFYVTMFGWFIIIMFLFLFLCLMLLICFVANFYTQKVQEQYSLYFKENS